MMMLNIVFIVLIGFILELFLPWWSIAIAAFGICAWRTKSVKEASVTGLSGTGILWLVIALIIHFKSGGILTERIAVLFSAGSSFSIIAITALIAGIVGGLAGISGFYFGKIILEK